MSPVSVTISAPSTAEQGQAFTVTGYVFDGPHPLTGVTVTIYQGGTSKGTALTNSSGRYSKNITINQTGTFPILSNALGVYSNVDYITITETAPEPHWEYHSTYRGIEIQVYMPDGTPYRAYYDGSWHTVSSLNILKLGIDAYLDAPDPSVINSVTISAPSSADENESFTISGTVRDQYGDGMGGVSVSLYDNGSRFATVSTNSAGGYSISHSISTAGVHELVANTSSMWAYRTINIIEPPPEPTGIPTTLTITVPASTGLNENFNISGILYETDTGIPIPNQPINHSYNGRSLGASTTGVDGSYLRSVSVPEAGVWTLKSEFPGTEGLQASRSTADTIVAATPITSALIIAGSIATGIVLFAYGTS